MPVGVERMLNHPTLFRAVCRLDVHAECVQIIVTPFLHISVYVLSLPLLYDPYVIVNTTCFSKLSSGILHI